jgi:hypothetical protein
MRFYQKNKAHSMVMQMKDRDLFGIWQADGNPVS